MKKLLLLLLPVLFLCRFHALAQNIAVTGKVTGQNNVTLAGVSIKVSGAKQGVASDASGNYSITAPANATLLFSHIGFLDQTVDVSGRTTINVTLEENSDSMQAVVVTALGIKKDYSAYALPR